MTLDVGAEGARGPGRDSAQADMAGRHRYEALDALRGVCALCVCLFHFRATGPLALLPFVRGSWLFVDFFFVLSGFVIAASSRERLVAGGYLRPFILLRLGRVYPLHVVVLAAFVVMELVGLALASKGLMLREPFVGPRSVPSIFSNLLLLQAVGLHPMLTWNEPGWSIAAEFWTYLLFALAAQRAGQRLEIWLVAAIIVSIAVLLLATSNGINVSHSWSLFRCIYGFAVGALAWRWWSDRGLGPQRGGIGATALELTAVALVVAFVSQISNNPVNLLAPLVFVAALLVFARQGGAVSRLLLRPPLQMLGLWSYSIYMVHVFVQSRMDDGLRLLGRATGLSFLSHDRLSNGTPFDRVGANAAQGVVLTFAMLAFVIAAAALTWQFIERPGQRWARRQVDALPSGRGVGRKHA
ncbi:MAG: acyltransferase [Alphaproteobacteria bacterium]|nr:MAG: acyltransferase [Alphaproteobacteria bacterium]